GNADSHPLRRGRATRRCATVGAWPAISDLLGVAVPSSYYEIRVAGVLPPEALLDFDRLTASVEPVETVVHGPLRDQAALGGLLARFEVFGVQVLEVRRVHGADPPDAAADGDVLPDSDVLPESDLLPEGKAMDIGPVELIVLVFPGEGAD